MDERRRFSLWTAVAPLAVLGVAVIAGLLVVGALTEPPPGPEPPAPTTVEAPALDASVPPTYRIRKGDTIGAIAERYGVSSDWILSLNPELDPMALAIGQRINLRQPAAP